MGWFGLKTELLHALRTVGADRGSDRAFLIDGARVTAGLGGEECLVPDATVYFRNGRPLPLAALLNGTSYGLDVVVL